MKHSETLYTIIAVLIVAIWGSTFISTKYLILEGLLPSQIFFIRFTLAYLGIWFIAPKRLAADNIKDELLMLLLGVSGGSLYFLTENTALEYTQASNVSFLVCSTPLYTTLWMTLRNREPLSGRIILGTLFALTGMALVVFNGKFILKLSPKGDLLALAAALCWSVYSVVLPELYDRYSSPFITRKVFFYGLVTILPFLVPESRDFDVTVLQNPIVITNLLGLGIVASLGCFVLWNKVVKVLGTVRASNLLYMNPLFTLIGGILILDEKFTPYAALGCTLILTGVILACRRDCPQEPNQ